MLIAVLSAAAVPQFLVGIDRSRTSAAARYVASRMILARTQAVSRGAAVAVRFGDSPSGVAVGVFIDGNRNGVRTRDIESFVDKPIGPTVSLSDLFTGVTVEPPSDTNRLFSFTSIGTATSGTVYLRGRDGSRFAVRVLGATARARVLRYVPARDEWIEAP